MAYTGEAAGAPEDALVVHWGYGFGSNGKDPLTRRVSVRIRAVESEIVVPPLAVVNDGLVEPLTLLDQADEFLDHVQPNGGFTAWAGHSQGALAVAQAACEAGDDQLPDVLCLFAPPLDKDGIMQRTAPDSEGLVNHFARTVRVTPEYREVLRCFDPMEVMAGAMQRVRENGGLAAVRLAGSDQVLGPQLPQTGRLVGAGHNVSRIEDADHYFSRHDEAVVLNILAGSAYYAASQPSSQVIPQ